MDDLEKAELLLQNGETLAYFHRMVELGQQGNLEALYRVGMYSKNSPANQGQIFKMYIFLYIAAQRGHDNAMIEMDNARDITEKDLEFMRIFAQYF